MKTNYLECQPKYWPLSIHPCGWPSWIVSTRQSPTHDMVSIWGWWFYIYWHYDELPNLNRQWSSSILHLRGLPSLDHKSMPHILQYCEWLKMLDDRLAGWWSPREKLVLPQLPYLWNSMPHQSRGSRFSILQSFLWWIMFHPETQPELAQHLGEDDLLGDWLWLAPLLIFETRS